MERARGPAHAGPEAAPEPERTASAVAGTAEPAPAVVGPDPGAGASAPCVSCGLREAADSCTHCGCARAAGGHAIVRVIAQTERGRVYEAVDRSGRRVALKELVFALVPGAQQLEQFERETQVLQQLDHPSIPRFVAAFRTGAGVQTRLFLAQEFVEGESLLARLAKHRFDEAEARDVAAQVLDILGYLHGLSPRLVHRDLKPANLIRRPDGRLALVDFDTARNLRADRTHGASLAGTFGYVPIEQLGGTVDATSDLYALGATLVHLLSARPPHELLGPDLQLRFAGQLRVGPAFEAWLTRLVARDPADRFRSAVEAAAALDAGTSTPPGAFAAHQQRDQAALANPPVTAAQREASGARAVQERGSYGIAWSTGWLMGALLRRPGKLLAAIAIAGAITGTWRTRTHSPPLPAPRAPPAEAGPVRSLGTIELWAGTPRGPIIIDGSRLDAGNAYVYLDTHQPQRQVSIGFPPFDEVSFILESDGTAAWLSVVRLPKDSGLTVNATPVSPGDRIPIDNRITFRTLRADKRGPMMQARFYKPGERTGP